MSAEIIKHPGLNLGAAHGADHEAAEPVIFGFWLFLMSDAILFGMVFATYVSSLSATAGGPGPRALYDLRSVFIETLLLLTSSFTFGMASLALKYRHGAPRLIGWLVVTLLLGMGFLGLECHDFVTMFAKGGVPGRSGYLSSFFDLVPLHGLHVMGGCIWLICLVGQIACYGIDRQVKLGIMRLALFWHFLDIVWIAIFSVVYLGGLT
ncbi:MAG TPA: cytochrome c oxidase subunit 3 [Steroidobacteraceae bacterium]|jgi:cytochrome o ubiquinol oxidase subunit III|nr:cytochrome c oxidase subunit 3 [Steroidobacteraceae bacterium]